MQSTRLLITLGNEHKRFWDTVITSAKPFVLENQGEEAWERNEKRFGSFRDAYGTVCYVVSFSQRVREACSPRAICTKSDHVNKTQISLFEDHTSIEELSAKIEKVPLSVLEGYAEHSDAMHQITLWTALELEGLGASLQHSQNVPGVEAGIKAAFEIPESWAIKAEILFGELPEGGKPEAPEKKAVGKTVRVFK